jgi:hypothetical protein
MLLTKEISALIERANDRAINTDKAEDRKLFAELGDALRALRQERDDRDDERMVYDNRLGSFGKSL